MDSIRPNPRVLVADDSQSFCAAVRGELEPLNVEIEETRDGVATLRQISQNRPDLITLDIEMPVLNGYRVLDQLRSNERTMTLPVIMISGRPSEAERLRALEAGAIEYFTKPFPPGELKALVSDVLGRIEANRSTTVYCVEQGENVRHQISTRLSTHGYRCRTFADMSALIVALSASTCDIVLLDLHLPERCTYRILDFLRTEPRHAAASVIGLTRCGVRKDLISAFQLGVEDFIRKPFYGEELLARIDHLMCVKRLQSNLERVAAIDPLTELPNRGELNRRFDIEVARAVRDNNCLGLLMVDIDRFKHVNDQRGHPFGDRVLQVVSATLEKTLRVTDVIGRYGGEEFLIAVPAATEAGLVRLAERVRAAVEQVRIPCGNELVGVTVSIGGCIWPGTELRSKLSRDALVQPADAALYRAKRDGRNTARMTFRVHEPAPGVDASRDSDSRPSVSRVTGTDG